MHTAIQQVTDQAIADDDSMENERFYAGKVAGILALKLAILAQEGAGK